MVVWFQSSTQGWAKYFYAFAAMLVGVAFVKLRAEGYSAATYAVGTAALATAAGVAFLGYEVLGLVPTATIFTAVLGAIGLWYSEWLRRANKLLYTEETFVDPLKGNQRRPFPSVLEAPSVDLSLVVPVSSRAIASVQ